MLNLHEIPASMLAPVRRTVRAKTGGPAELIEFRMESLSAREFATAYAEATGARGDWGHAFRYAERAES